MSADEVWAATYFFSSDYHDLWREEVARGAIRWHGIPSSISGVVVEVGCGEGRVARRVLRMFEDVSFYVGVDVSANALNYARKSLVNAKKVELVQADGRYLPFRGGAFHFVLCIETAHYIPDLEGLLAEVSSVLKEEGLFICDFPDMSKGRVALHFALRRIFNRLHGRFKMLFEHLAKMLDTFPSLSFKRYGLSKRWLVSVLRYGATPFFPARESWVMLALGKVGLKAISMVRSRGDGKLILLAKKT